MKIGKTCRALWGQRILKVHNHKHGFIVYVNFEKNYHKNKTKLLGCDTKKKKVVLLSNLVLSHFPTIPLCSFSNFQMLLLFVVREKREREERGLRDPQLHQPPSASICWKAAAHAEEEAPGIAHVSHCTDSSAVNVRVHAEK